MKTSCPRCFQHYDVDDAYLGTYVDCQGCGKRFRVSATSGESATPADGSEKLSMTTALVFQCITIGYTFISTLVSFADEDGETTGVLAVLFLVPLILNLIFSAKLHYRCWKAIPEEFARMTPGKAVGYLFIPFFNLYWLFPSVGGLGGDCAFLAKNRNIRGFDQLKSFGLVLAILMCCGWVFGAVPVLGLLISIGEFVIWLMFYNDVVKLLNGIRFNLGAK